MFLTTFAPFYPKDHSRHQYGAGGSSTGWVLFQPEFSFAAKNVSCGHEPTNWSNPQSERDRVRASFAAGGQNYILDCPSG